MTKTTISPDQIAALAAAQLAGDPLPDGWAFVGHRHAGHGDAFDAYFRGPDGKVRRLAIAGLEDLTGEDGSPPFGGFGSPCSADPHAEGGCPGWGVFHSAEHGDEIERCDDCGRFADDLAALRYVEAMARAAERAGLRPAGVADLDPIGNAWLRNDAAGRDATAGDSDPLVCSHCGAEGVHVTAWVDVNTRDIVSNNDADAPLSVTDCGGAWCPACEHSDGGAIPRSEYEANQAAAEAAALPAGRYESATGLTVEAAADGHLVIRAASGRSVGCGRLMDGETFAFCGGHSRESREAVREAFATRGLDVHIHGALVFP